MKWWQHLHYRKCWQKCSWTTGCACKKSTKTDLICNVLFCQLLSASEHSNNTITLPLKRKSSLLNKCIPINIIWYRHVLFFLMSMKCLLQKPFLTAQYMYLFGTECNDICVHGHQQTNKPVLVRMSKPWKSVNWPLPVNKITQS